MALCITVYNIDFPWETNTVSNRTSCVMIPDFADSHKKHKGAIDNRHLYKKFNT